MDDQVQMETKRKLSPHRSKEERIEWVQKVNALKETGLSVVQACKELGVITGNYYNWTEKYGFNPVQAAREIKTVNTDEVKTLRVENQRLRTIVSDLMLDKQALQEYAGRR